MSFKGRIPLDLELDESASRFISALHDNGWVVPFDWVSWQGEAQRYVSSPEMLESADVDVIRKLLTMHIRKERFCDGHLLAVFRSGHLNAILRRLKALRKEGW